MSVIPQSGNFAVPFTVSLNLDGHGDIFNAAEATITKSENMAIKDLALGDCQFSFLKTPSIYNLSFEGIIMAGKREKCTLYTITLIPIDSGEGFLKISEATVKRYGDAAEILSYAQNGIYTLTKSDQADITSPLPIPPASLEGLYTLGLKITSEKAIPINDAVVSITNPQLEAPIEKRSNSQGLVYFTNLKSDVYTATISAAQYQTTQNILNIAGNEQAVQLSIRMQPTKPKQPITLIVGFFLAIIFLAITFNKKVIERLAIATKIK